jgi:hypothetical protein
MQNKTKTKKKFLKFYKKQKACQKSNPACFFNAFERVVKLPLLKAKKSCKVRRK